MLRPPYLQPGDQVAFVSPAGIIDKTYIENAAETVRSWGLVPVVGKHTTSQHGYFAGTDSERMEDMQWALDDEDIKAVFCTRGGYGCIRIVERIDYSRFQGNPKWLVGFSDITVFHAKINSLGIESLHAAMPKSYPTTKPEALEQLKQFLFGRISPYILPPHPLNRAGVVRAELVGGNLSLLHCLNSSVIEHKYHHNIMFTEDVGENLYAIDRILQSLKLTGKLEHLEGMVVGGFSEMKGLNFGKDAYEIVAEAVEDYAFPVCFGFPAGHIPENYPLIMGAYVEFTVNEEGSELIFL